MFCLALRFTATMTFYHHNTETWLKILNVKQLKSQKLNVYVPSKCFAVHKLLIYSTQWPMQNQVIFFNDNAERKKKKRKKR